MRLSKRARVARSPVGTFRRWVVFDTSIAVVEIESALGLPKRWVVVEAVGEGELIRSRHRKRKAAEAAAVRLAELRKSAPLSLTEFEISKGLTPSNERKKS